MAESLRGAQTTGGGSNRRSCSCRLLQPPAYSQRGTECLFVIEMHIHREWPRLKERDKSSSSQPCSTSWSLLQCSSQWYSEAHFRLISLLFYWLWSTDENPDSPRAWQPCPCQETLKGARIACVRTHGLTDQDELQGKMKGNRVTTCRSQVILVIFHPSGTIFLQW